MIDTLERIACALERIAEHCERQPRPRQEGQLLSTAQVADILQCSEDHVLNLRARGDLRAVKIGVAWRFPRESVSNLVGGGLSGPVGVVRQIGGGK